PASRRPPHLPVRDDRAPAHRTRREGGALHPERIRRGDSDRARAGRGHHHVPEPLRTSADERSRLHAGLRRGVLHLAGRRCEERGRATAARRPDRRTAPARTAESALLRPPGRCSAGPAEPGGRRCRRRGVAKERRRRAARAVPGSSRLGELLMAQADITEREARPDGSTGHSPAATPPVRRAKKSFASRLRRDRSLLLMVLPAVALTLVFKYVPMLGNIVAWQHYSPYIGITERPWAGWENFQRLLTDSTFHNAVINTISITTFQLFFYFPIPIVMALLLNSVLTPWIRSTIQSIVYLPHFFSWVLVVTVFQQILGGAGLLNRVLRDNDMTPVDIMTNPDPFLLLLPIEAPWK